MSKQGEDTDTKWGLGYLYEITDEMMERGKHIHN